MPVIPVPSSSIQASSASAVTSTSAPPSSSAWRTMVAIVTAASLRLWGTLEMRLAPWAGWTRNMLGKPWTWTPCSDRMPDPVLGRRRPPGRRGRTRRPAGGVGADLEPRGVDDAVDQVLDAGRRRRSR